MSLNTHSVQLNKRGAKMSWTTWRAISIRPYLGPRVDEVHYLEVARHFSGELGGVHRGLLVEVDGGGMLEQRVLFVDGLLVRAQVEI